MQIEQQILVTDQELTRFIVESRSRMDDLSNRIEETNQNLSAHIRQVNDDLAARITLPL